MRHWLIGLFLALALILSSANNAMATETIGNNPSGIAELISLADKGDGEAAYELGRIYEYGLLDEAQDFTKAYHYYQISHSKNNPLGSLALGYMYLNGCGTYKSLAHAESCFKSATLGGISEGYVGIGRVALLSPVTTASARKAYNNIKKAAEDESCIDAQYYMGYLYENGIGTIKNYDEAMKRYFNVLDLGIKREEDSFAVDMAYTRLGLMYLKGIGTEVDVDEAIAMFREASDDGFSMASFYIGVIYEMGAGNETSDYEEAIRWYELAAEREYAPALNQLGCMYCKGLGVEVDYSQALYFQKRSAAQGYAPAQINLGYLYENGLGVERDLDTARSYYLMARSAGHEGTGAAIDRINELINQSNEQ